MQHPYLPAIILLHVGFAGGLLLLHRQQPSRFAKWFALSWLIEAVRGAILLPPIHTLGGRPGEWYCLSDLLCFFATWFLLAACAELAGKKLPRWLAPIYFGTGLPLVLIGRYLFPWVMQRWFGWSWEAGRFHGILGNLIVMFLPVTAARVIITVWLFQLWRRTGLPGALVASIFCVPYAIIAIAVPFQFYYSYHPSWVSFFWLIRVLGFSLGILMLLLSQKQKDLEQSEQRLRNVMNGLGPDTFAGLLTPEGIVVEANEPALRATGLRADEIMGKPFDQLRPWSYSPEVQARLRQAIERAAQGEASRYEAPVLAAGGQFITIDFSLQPLRDDSGKVVFLVPSATVVTARKVAEAEVQRQRAELETIFDAAPAIIFYKDRQLRIMRANRELCRCLGKSRAEIEGRTAREFGSPFAAQYEEDDRQVLTTGQPIRGRIEPIQTASGPGWARTDKVPLLDAAGQVTGIVGFAVDITEEKRALEALTASEGRFRELAESLQQLIYEGHPETFIANFVNSYVEQLYGYSPAEWLGDPGLWERTIHPEDRERVFREFQAAKEKGEAAIVQYRIVRKDNLVRWVEDQVHWDKNERGEIISRRGVMHDITDRKETETKLNELAGRLLRLQDEERRRIGRELHDSTAQTLAALEVNLSLLRQSASWPAEGKNKLTSASLDLAIQLARQCSTEIRTVSYLLHPPLLDEIGLASALRWYVEGFSKRSGIEVHLDLSEPLERLSTDRELALFRVAQESLANVHRHSGSPTATIRLRGMNGGLELRVIDQGRGLSPAALRAFAAGVGSLGIGLAGMRERLRQLGGSFEVDSATPGTTIVARLSKSGPGL